MLWLVRIYTTGLNSQEFHGFISNCPVDKFFIHAFSVYYASNTVLDNMDIRKDQELTSEFLKGTGYHFD